MHTILDFAEQAVERLVADGCRLVVVACNTVSCVALRHLHAAVRGRQRGPACSGVTIPGAEAAVAASGGGGRVGILATARTVASQTYVTEIHKLDPTVRVSQRAAPVLVPIVEDGWADTDVARLAVQRYLADLPDIDTLLLGCTHYPLLLPVFRERVAAGVRVVDPAPYLAERLVDWLGRHPGWDVAGPGPAGAVHGGPRRVPAARGAVPRGPLPAVHAVAEVGGRLADGATVVPVGQIVR
ncbi:MAG: aspartate/glutamate racemase family protein [Myxococcota bacterium]